MPEDERGAYADLTDGGAIIGVVLRTNLDTKPIYVAIGHKLDLKTALKWTLSCCRGYRVPEPTRYAHLADNS